MMEAWEEKECFLCGRNGNGDPLDRHHIFNGANRKKSETIRPKNADAKERLDSRRVYTNIRKELYIGDESK